jgi:hypothetical protein
MVLVAVPVAARAGRDCGADQQRGKDRKKERADHDPNT